VVVWKLDTIRTWAVAGRTAGQYLRGLGSTAQHSALRSVGDAQDAAPALPGMPSEKVGAVRAEMRNPLRAGGSTPRGAAASALKFPKYKYHADHEAVFVDNAEDEAKLGEGWQDVLL